MAKSIFIALSPTECEDSQFSISRNIQSFGLHWARGDGEMGEVKGTDVLMGWASFGRLGRIKFKGGIFYRNVQAKAMQCL